MRAEILSCEVSDSLLDSLHGETYKLNRILIPELNNMVITIQGESVYISDDFEKDESCQVVKEIDIQDSIIEKIENFFNQKKELIRQIDWLYSANF